MKDIVERIDFHEKNMEISQQEHLLRYLFALPFVREKKVLDIACGIGYGSYYLAPHCKKIIGVDLSPEALASAKKRYSHKALSFAQMDAHKTSFPEGSFDVVLSYETIEHLKDDKLFLSEIKRILKPDGLFFVSFPHILWSKTYGLQNPFHFREYALADVKKLLSLHFQHFEVISQYRVSASLLMKPLAKQPLTVDLFHNTQALSTALPLCFLAVCSDVEIPSISLVMLATKEEISDLHAYVSRLKSIILQEDSKILALVKAKLGRLFKKSKKLYGLLQR